MKDNVKNLTYGGLLIAITIVIALAVPKVIIGPFTATLTVHVPVFISMLLGPEVAIMVGIGSVIGFAMTGLPLVVTARAAAHIAVGLVGALLIKKDVSFGKAIAITAPIHGILEALIVIPFGYTVYKVLIVVFLGTVIHHAVDGTISFALAHSLGKATNYSFFKKLNAKSVVTK